MPIKATFLALCIFFFGFNKSATAEEYWVSQSSSKSIIIILKEKGEAEYIDLSQKDRSIWFVHSNTAKWGLHPFKEGSMLLGIPSNEIIKRFLWVSVDAPNGQGWRFDYAEVADKMFEIDKMGIQNTLFKVNNGERRKIARN